MSTDQMTAARDPEMKLAITSADDAKYVEGRRAFFKYRDLGVTDATNGRMRAQLTSAEGGASEPTGWHYHECEMQFVYVLNGWVDLEFENGEKVRFKAGDSVMIPGGARHQEIEFSKGFEILEVSVPADMGTVACDPPNA